MLIDELIIAVRELLEHEGRVAYRMLKRRFELNDDDLEDIKAELIDAKRIAADEDGKVMVWLGAPQDDSAVTHSRAPAAANVADRRLITVMFCDIVGSTEYSARFDAEELRDIVREYQQICSTIIARCDGHVAQYLGDGLLVYFGYPAALEDEAGRSVELAKQRGAVGFALRTALSLVELDIEQSATRANQGTLEKLRTAFTEGSQTHDLQHADRLLARIA